MTLKEKIETEMKDALKAKNKARLTVLRAVKSQILLAEREKGAAASGISQEKEIQLLNKAVKQRKESYETYVKAGRDDLAAVEKLELAVIQEFLPEQISAEEIEKTLIDIIAQTNASNIKDMGKVMGVATKVFAGKADNKLVANTVKKLLANR